jgi:3-hydroxypropanoate dehydrogenase
MSAPIDSAALHQLFIDGRTHNAFLDKPVSDETLLEVARLTALGPTEANMLPGRFVFVKSAEAKAKLDPCMAEGNKAKTLAAPATIIAAYDQEFYEHLPRTMPHVDARSWYVNRDEAGKRWVAERSTALQIGYLTMAARALGLDVGPMAGFDPAAVDAAFLAGTTWKSYVLINIGYGDTSKLFPRSPRLDLPEFARIV